MLKGAILYEAVYRTDFQTDIFSPHVIVEMNTIKVPLSANWHHNILEQDHKK